MNPNEFLKSELLKRIPDIDKFCEDNKINRSTFDSKIDRLHEEDIYRELVFKKAGLVVKKIVEYDVKEM